MFFRTQDSFCSFSDDLLKLAPLLRDVFSMGCTGLKVLSKCFPKPLVIVGVSQPGHVEWWSDAFGILALYGSNAQLEDRSDQSVVCLAFGTTHGFGYLHVLDISLPDDNKVIQVPLLELWVHPSWLVLAIAMEDGVDDAQHMLGTFAK